MRLHRGFTLIELLVVIAIITALLAILVPSLNRTLEISSRAICASNQHQFYLATLNYAADNLGRYPKMHRDAWTQSDHVSWVSSDAFNLYIQESAIDMTLLTCPNRGEEYIVFSNGNYRLGYYYLFGRNDGLWSHAPWESWSSPQSITKPGSGVMATDVIELSTVHPPQASVSHSSAGVIVGARYASAESLGSDGGNEARTDGSVTWTAQADMSTREASSSGNVIGTW